MRKILLLAAVALFAFSANSFSGTYTLTIDGATKQGSVPHFWSRCVGTGGAQLCLDSNWRKAAKIGVAEAGFKAFRGHLNLSASNPISWGGTGTTPTFNWATWDSIYDFYVDTLKTVPVVELSAMPKDLRSGSSEWTTPKDFTVWGSLVNAVVSHCITRYGREKVRTWSFEVWNEWDYSGFWNGTEAQYYQLYQNAVQGAMAADSQIQIGGPSTTGSGGTKLTNFLSFCATNNLKVSFLSNHCYGGGGSGANADPATVRNDNRTRSTAIKNSGKALGSFNTEYNSSYSGQGGNAGANCISMDSHVNAPFVTKCVKLILDDYRTGTAQIPDVFSYWTISDVFDEGSYISGHSYVPFGDVFGLINYQGIRKATFNAFKMMNMLGSTRLSCTGGSADADGIDGFAVMNSDSTQVAVLVYNFYKALAGSANTNLANITVNNLPFANGQSVQVTHYRVDSLHSNPYAVWLKQAKPQKPTSAQFDSLRAASELALLKPTTTYTYTAGQAWTDSFTMPQQSLSLIVFSKAGSSAVKSSGIGQASTRGLNAAIVAGKLMLSGAAQGTWSVRLFSPNGQKVYETSRVLAGSASIALPRSLRGAYILQCKGTGNSLVKQVVVNP